MKIACFIFVCIISAGTALLFFVNVNEQQQNFASKPIGVCGGVVYPDGYIPYKDLSEEAKLGSDLFKANCAACHKIDAASTGPALRNVKIRYEEEGKNLDSFFKVNRIFLKGKKIECFIPPEITDKDIQNILAYTN